MMLSLLTKAASCFLLVDKLNFSFRMEEDKRRRFGGRFLTEEDNVFKHNAWDDVEWTEEQLEAAREAVKKNSATPVTQEKREHYQQEAGNYWDKFYGIHANRYRFWKLFYF